MIKRAFPILALSIFCAMLGVGMVVPLLPLFADEMGATGLELGILMAAYGIVNIVATPVMGGLSDRKGRKVFICIGLLWYAIISLGFVWAATISQLIVIRLIYGVAGAMVMPISMAYIGDISPEGEEGKWTGYANAAFFSGFGFGPLMGGVLAERFGMDAAFFAMGGLCLLAFLIAVPFLPESRQRKATERAPLSLTETLKEMSSRSMIRGLFSFRLVQALGRGGLMAFLPLFAATRAGLGPALIGVVLAVNMLLITVLTAPAGRLADRFNRKAMVIIGSFLYFVSLVLIPLTHNFWQLIWLCIPRGIGGAMSMTGTMALTVVEGRRFGMGTTMSILMMAMAIGMAIGPIVSGVIYDSININAVFFFGAVMTLIGTGLFAWFTR